jgi:hypothetical protein
MAGLVVMIVYSEVMVQIPLVSKVSQLIMICDKTLTEPGRPVMLVVPANEGTDTITNIEKGNV